MLFHWVMSRKEILNQSFNLGPYSLLSYHLLYFVVLLFNVCYLHPIDMFVLS